jgi:uncharacterized protein (DUF305 family)
MALQNRSAVNVVLAVSVLALLNAAGCSSSSSSHSQHREAPARMTQKDASLASTVQSEQNFVDASIKSCQWSMDMCDLVIANGQRSEVRKIAMQLRKREESNLVLLQEERSRLGISGEMPDHRADPYMDLDLARLRGLSGDDADGFFLDRMIDQRRVMSQFAASSQNQLRDEKLRYLAQQMPDDRNRDVRELRAVEDEQMNVPRNAQAGTRYPGWQGYRTRYR